MHLSRKVFIDIIKVLIATSVLTGLFLWGSDKVGDHSTENIIEDYVNLEDDEMNINTGEIGHNASTIDSVEDLCASKISLCNKINFVGDFIDEEKVKYIKTEDKITGFITTKNAQKRDFLETIRKIDINEIEGKRGYATRDNIVINIGSIMSADEFTQISTHELGHIVDLGFLQGNSKIKEKVYTEFNKAVFANNDPSIYFYKISRDSETIRRAEAKKENFCSVYGMTDPFEDFAECFNLYLNHNKFFKYLAQKDTTLGRKYNFLASMFKGQYINANIANIKLAKKNPNNRVRDTTKISIN